MSTKGEQIISRLFFKVALLISDARENHSARTGTGGKADKWFQLEVLDDGRFGELTQELRELGGTKGGTLEMRVRSVLVLGPPSPAQALVLVSDSERRKRVEIPPEASAIQLEEWSLSPRPFDKARPATGRRGPVSGSVQTSHRAHEKSIRTAEPLL
ncbi:hypothetical protein OPQ81_000595 [Rhizoctonia solani]|nr:hypothetical protein OPQ81_000595 [Rhizoctonia solani]